MNHDYEVKTTSLLLMIMNAGGIIDGRTIRFGLVEYDASDVPVQDGLEEAIAYALSLIVKGEVPKEPAVHVCGICGFEQVGTEHGCKGGRYKRPGPFDLSTTVRAGRVDARAYPPKDLP